MNRSLYSPVYADKMLAPSAKHIFGTDYLGRDMFFRTLKGLSASILIGTLAATSSAIIALALGLLSALRGGITDKIVSWFVDLFMSIPHLVLLMLVSYMLGKGERGVIIAIAITHWPGLTRLLRAEVLQVRDAPFVKTAARLGSTPLQIAAEHIVPHILPQFITGLILLFPHAILHEAAITFIGFGLALDTPAIGIILSESLAHISQGAWYLVFFPGTVLVVIVMLLDKLGEYVKLLADPMNAQE
ncbi:peptide ABC transporter permease [Spirochaetia bacterium]|nr:peptide ABC transporter permease [Spirochaetia bacterium]